MGQTGQNAKFVLNNGGGHMGQTGQNVKFVLNNRGAKRVKQVKTPNSC